MRRLTLSGVPPADAAVMARSSPAVTSPDTAPVPRAASRRRAGDGAPGRLGAGARAGPGGDVPGLRRVPRAARAPHSGTSAWSAPGSSWRSPCSPRWASAGGPPARASTSSTCSPRCCCACSAGSRPRSSSSRDDRPVILCCVPEDLHTPAAARARGRGRPSAASPPGCSGPGCRPSTWSPRRRRSGPAGIVLHAQLPVPMSAVLALLRRLRPAPRLIVTGPGWRRAELPRVRAERPRPCRWPSTRCSGPSPRLGSAARAPRLASSGDRPGQRCAA